MPALKMFNGALGLIVSSTNEAQQEDLFFPCDPRLVAVNVNGDPTLGSLVFDLNGANELDSQRGAHLQAAFRVIKRPLGGANSIAFQLDYTGKADTGGGFFCEVMSAPTMEMPPGADGEGDSGGDPSAGGVPEFDLGVLEGSAAQFKLDGAPGNTVVQGVAVPPAGGFGFGEGSHNYGGPFHVGIPGDKHYHGDDADGNPINALHIWTSANFFMNKLADGPVRFELEYKKGDDLEHPVPCHLAWTGADWAIWTTAPMYKIVPQQPIRPLDPGVPGIPSPGVPGRPAVASPGVPRTGAVTDGRVPGSQLTPNMVASLAAMVAPIIMMRPENYITSVPSTGLFDFKQGFSDAEGGIPSGFGTDQTASKKKKADKSSPITAMASAFGAQGGFVDAGGSGSGTNVGGSGDPWVYTQIPRGTKEVGRKTSLYPGGTASGGIIYHPPETDLRDIDSGMVPDNVTLSETRIMCAPGASFGVGIPNLETGSIKTGVNWVYDSSTGDAVWHTYSFTTESEALRLTNPTQLIRWMSGQSFYGEFSHTNTANRTWTFPDVTSTISSILFDTVAPTATATEGTFGWDTVANNLYVNNDGATGWSFVGGASSVTGSGAATRVTYWSSATALTSDAGFTFDGITLTLSDSNAATIPLIIINQAGTGDTGFRWTQATAHSYIAGIDNSDSDRFKISYAASGTAVLGTNDYFIIATAGDASFPNGDLSVVRSEVGSFVIITAGNDDNTSASSHSLFRTLAGGASGGDAIFRLTISGVRDWDLYVDNDDSDSFKFSTNSSVVGTILTGGNWGIGTTGPDAKLDVLSTSAQLRLTHTDGSIYCDIQVDSNGDMNLAPTGDSFTWVNSGAGVLTLINSINGDDTNGASHAAFRCLTGGASGGDPKFLFTIAGVVDWSMGSDNSDSDKFKVSNSSNLGTNDYLTIKTTGVSSFASDIVSLDSAKGLVLKDTAGTPHYWRVSVDTSGVLTTADLGTSAP